MEIRKAMVVASILLCSIHKVAPSPQNPDTFWDDQDFEGSGGGPIDTFYNRNHTGSYHRTGGNHQPVNPYNGQPSGGGTIDSGGTLDFGGSRLRGGGRNNNRNNNNRNTNNNNNRNRNSNNDYLPENRNNNNNNNNYDYYDDYNYYEDDEDYGTVEGSGDYYDYDTNYDEGPPASPTTTQKPTTTTTTPKPITTTTTTTTPMPSTTTTTTTTTTPKPPPSTTTTSTTTTTTTPKPSTTTTTTAQPVFPIVPPSSTPKAALDILEENGLAANEDAPNLYGEDDEYDYEDEYPYEYPDEYDEGSGDVEGDYHYPDVGTSTPKVEHIDDPIDFGVPEVHEETRVIYKSEDGWKTEEEDIRVDDPHRGVDIRIRTDEKDIVIQEIDMDNTVQIINKEDDSGMSSLFDGPGMFTISAIIGCSVVGLLCAILLVMFVVYRMRKRDEGSYPLDEPKRLPLTSPYATADKEIYA